MGLCGFLIRIVFSASVHVGTAGQGSPQRACDVAVLPAGSSQRSDCGQGAPGRGQGVPSAAQAQGCRIHSSLEPSSSASETGPPWSGIRPTWVSVSHQQTVCNLTGMTCIKYSRAKSSISLFYAFTVDIYFKSQHK